MYVYRDTDTDRMPKQYGDLKVFPYFVHILPLSHMSACNSLNAIDEHDAMKRVESPIHST